MDDRTAAGPAPAAPAAPSAGGPLRRLHEDERLVVIDKPAGLLVHRSALDAHEPDNVLVRLHRESGAWFRPVHRLDKGTSGVLVLARDADAARRLGAAFEPVR
jgi:tRNA pseudouridine65 synthase